MADGAKVNHAALDLDRASDGIDDARELDQRAVAHELDVQLLYSAFVGVLTKRDAVGLEAPDAAVMRPGDALQDHVLEGRAGHGHGPAVAQQLGR